MPLKGKALGCVSRHSYYLRVSSTNQKLSIRTVYRPKKAPLPAKGGEEEGIVYCFSSRVT